MLFPILSYKKAAQLFTRPVAKPLSDTKPPFWVRNKADLVFYGLCEHYHYSISVLNVVSV